MSKKRVGGSSGVSNKRSQTPRFRLMPKLRLLAKKFPQLAQEFIHSWNLVKLIIAIEVVINIIVIKNVKYTEIDWSTYMAQVTQISNFSNLNFNYTEIEGPTGPLVYPAGHVYIFYLFKALTEGGTNIQLAQHIYACIYIAQLILTYKIYSFKRFKLGSTTAKDKVPPYMFLITCFASYRIHSIYILRLFNDPVAILIAYASFYALLRKKHTLSAFLFSFAIAVKMNILLFAPAYALIFYEDLGLIRSIKNACVALATQIILAIPFLYTNPAGYMQRAFDFNRNFLHQWTVNWRFLDEDTFTSPQFYKILLLVHVLLLFFMFWSRWLNVLFMKRFTFNVRRDDAILTLFITNFIGVSCSRSLHYQFYVWYYHSLPMILWATRYSTVLKILILGCIEYSWNEYPSTTFSSLLLHTSHLAILIGLFTRHLKSSMNVNDAQNRTVGKKKK